MIYRETVKHGFSLPKGSSRELVIQVATSDFYLDRKKCKEILTEEQFNSIFEPQNEKLQKRIDGYYEVTQKGSLSINYY